MEIIALVAIIITGASLYAAWRTQQQMADLRTQMAFGERELQAMRSATDDREKLYDTLVQLVVDAVLILDAQQRVTMANVMAEKIFGTELVGKTLIGATRLPELERFVTENGYGNGDEDDTPERLMEYPGEPTRILRARFVKVGKQLIILLRDETELQRLGRARREMVANISHELRTPITTIGLLADTLLTGVLKKSKRSRKMVTEIRREVDTLTQLVQEMRDLSLIESGQMPVKMMPENLADIVETSIEPLRSLAERKNQAFTVHTPPEHRVLADASQMQRVIKNIVHNGIKFAPEGGFIDLSAELDGDEVRVAISNNGPGIAREDLPRIFERFFQADRARSDGTGLGLAIARHIVLSHGGKIWAESTTNEGATFYFTLPVAEPSDELPTQPLS